MNNNIIINYVYILLNKFLNNLYYQNKNLHNSKFNYLEIKIK